VFFSTIILVLITICWFNIKWSKEDKKRLDDRHVDFRNILEELNDIQFIQLNACVKMGPFGAFLLIEQSVGEALDCTDQ
jgi:predicted phosphatase